MAERELEARELQARQKDLIWTAIAGLLAGVGLASIYYKITCPAISPGPWSPGGK
jgi:hypothetical protein